MRFYNPKNFKQGQLILNRFYKKDIVILLIYMTLSLILIIGVLSLADPNNSILFASLFLFALLPGAYGIFVTTPLTGYHNANEFLKLKMNKKKYLKKYMWEGLIYDDTD